MTICHLFRVVNENLSLTPGAGIVVLPLPYLVMDF
jgi:hypothetical protein